ncbi:MAG: hypothetical protein ACK5F7_17105 [Planctomycetaceae bacterium]
MRHGFTSQLTLGRSPGFDESRSPGFDVGRFAQGVPGAFLDPIAIDATRAGFVPHSV